MSRTENYKQKQDFLRAFSREAQYIRDSIINDLPAYNMLLNARAETFEEAALRLAAQERSSVYVKQTPPMPSCPHCGQHQNVGTKGSSGYYCKSCQRKFTATHNSISSGTKCDAIVWMKVLICLLNFSGLTKTCEYCGISPNTYYQIRNRLFYAMQLLLNDVKLYGVVQVDNTFVRASYKGMDLRESEFDEESIFFDDRFIPRNAHKRGGPVTMEDRTANSICVFTGIDDHGHVLARFAGIGMPTAKNLIEYIPKEKFLTTVPKKDAFQYFCKKTKSTAETKPGAVTRMVSDKEKAIKNFADTLDVEFESHVYRKDGVQRRLSEESQNIQRVNALHRRLKDFLRKSNYVSTKYLPGFLTFFEFLENTGASSEAIERLFQILATPGLGRPPSFYQELFSVPNYLLVWFDSDNPLRKLLPRKRLAFYLYDHIRRKEEYPDTTVTMAYIEKETGYTAPSIRKNYRNLCDAGYREQILRYYGEPTKKEKNKSSGARKRQIATKTINPVVLAIYDEYVATRSLPYSERPKFAAFLKEKNEQYGTNFKRTNMLAKFSYIEEKGYRTPRPEIINQDKSHGFSISNKMLSIYDDYNELVLSYRKQGVKVPGKEVLCEQLKEKYNLATSTIYHYVLSVRAYYRKEKRTDGNQR